jgi:hypothetical protein
MGWRTDLKIGHYGDFSKRKIDGHNQGDRDEHGEWIGTHFCDLGKIGRSVLRS